MQKAARKESGDVKTPTATAKNKDINTHLSRVLKLIQTREEAIKEENQNPSPSSKTQKSGDRRSVTRGSSKNNNNLKRSMTSVTAERKSPKSGNLRGDSQSRLSRLRIVKSIHSSVIQVNVNKPGAREDFSEDNIGSGQLSPNSNAPLQPLGFMSWQQQRSFVPEPMNLVMQGKQKPTITRLAQDGNKSPYGSCGSQGVESRENGCQTTPPQRKKDLSCSSKNRDDSNKLGTSLHVDEDDHDGPVRVSTFNHSTSKLREENMSSAGQVNRKGTKIVLPNKINFRGNNSHRHSSVQASLEKGRNRDFQISLLKSSQFEANEKFMLRENISTQGSNNHLRLPKPSGYNGSVTASHAYQSTKNGLSSSAQHTALRMTQRRDRKALASQPQNKDMHLDVLSWDPDSVPSPVSRENYRLLFSQSNNRGSRGFQDDSSKPVTNKVLAKSLIRQQQQNKTQQFFYLRQPVANITTSNFNKLDGDRIALLAETTRSLCSDQPTGWNTQISIKELYDDEKNKEGNHHRQESILSAEDQVIVQNDYDRDVGLLDEQQQHSFKKKHNSNNTQSSLGNLYSFKQHQSSQLQIEKTTQQSSLTGGGGQVQSITGALGGGAHPQNNASKVSGSETVKICQTEKRIVNQLAKELDSKEFLSYKRHDKQSQVIYNDKESTLFNLAEHPEWKPLQSELQAIYTSALEDFNFQVVAQNYYIRSELKEKHSVSTSQVIQRNHKSDFLSTCIGRMKNLFSQQQRLTSESIRQMGILNEKIVGLQEENEKLRRSQNSLKDAQTVINELVDKYFRNGHEKDLKSARIKEAEIFLASEPLTKMINEEVFQTVSKIEYSDTLTKLEEIFISMQLPSTQDDGVKFTMTDHVFDPEFSKKIKLLFSNKFKTVQYDSALRGLEMVYRDIRQTDFGVQVNDRDVDTNLTEQIEFYKGEITRLQGENNTMKHKMLANDKSTKAAIKTNNDSKNSAQALEKNLKDTRAAQTGLQSQVSTLKALNDRTGRDNDNLVTMVGRMRINSEKKERYEKMTEKMIEKIYMVNTRQKVLIKDQDSIIEELAEIAGPDFDQRIQSIRHLRERIDAQGANLSKAMDDFKKKALHKGQSETEMKELTKAASTQRRNTFKSSKTEFMGDGDEELAEYERMKNHQAATPKRKSQLSRKATQGSIKNSADQQKPSDTVSKGSGSRGGKPPAKKKKKPVKKVQINEGKNTMMKSNTSERSCSDLQNIHKSNISSHPSDLGGDSYANMEIDEEGNDQDLDNNTNLSLSFSNNSEFDLMDKEIKKDDKYSRSRNSPSRMNTTKDRKRSVNAQVKPRPQNIQTPQSKRKSFYGSFKGDRDDSPLIRTGNKFKQGTLVNTIGAEQDYEEDLEGKMTPTLGGANIVIKTINQSSGGCTLKNQGTQSDTEIFFSYIFDYLAELERKISSGEITIEEVLMRGRESMLETADEAQRIAMQSWAYQSPEKKRMTFSINELKECLLRLKSLGAHGGDIFFAGLARTMVYKPVIPRSFQFGQNALKKDAGDTANAKCIEQEMKKLQKMTRMQTSTGGGSGPTKDYSSPTKAAMAAQNVNFSGLSAEQHHNIARHNSKSTVYVKNNSTVSFGHNSDLSPVRNGSPQRF